MNAIKSQFTLDCLEPYFNGYTFGDTWNGWACPYFSKRTAYDLLIYMKEHDLIKGFTYCDTADLPYFEIEDNEGEKEIVEQDILEYKGNEREVYGIGNHAWVWWDKKWD